MNHSDVQDVLLAMLHDLKEGSRNRRNIYCEAQINLLERIILLLEKIQSSEEIDMKKVRMEFGGLVTIDALPAMPARDSIKKQVLEESKKLKPGQARVINADTVKWVSLVNAVSKLHKANELPPEVAAVRGEKEHYLAYLAK